MLKKILIPFSFIAMGVAIFMIFNARKPQPNKEKKPFLGALVEVMSVEKTQRQIQLSTHGVVKEKERVIITPQISGTINWIHPSLTDGEFFEKGEILLTLDPNTSGDLDSTVIKAPFNSVVQNKSADIGQYVTPGTQLVTLIGSDVIHVHADLPLRDFSWLRIAQPPNKFFAPAKVSLQVGTQQQQWEALIVRHLLELSPQGLMVPLVLSIEDPFHLRAEDPQINSFPLFIGAFVNVEIPGQTLRDIFVVPTDSIRNQNSIWLYEDGKLVIREVEILYIQKEETYLSQGVAEGELIVLSPLKGAAPGLKLRIKQETSPKIRKSTSASL